MNDATPWQLIKHSQKRLIDKQSRSVFLMQYSIYIQGDLAPQIPTPTSPVVVDDALHATFPALDQINQLYREFLWNSVPEEQEWTATSRFMEYISMDVISISVQKDKGDPREKTNWQLELLFSSCGGTSEVSSHLAAHWAHLWYGRCRNEIDANLLVPQGFLPHAKQPEFKFPQFAPIPGHSYALFDPDRNTWTDSHFEINVALADSLDTPVADLIQGLQQTYGELMRDGRCRCQLCMPDFRPAEAA